MTRLPPHDLLMMPYLLRIGLLLVSRFVRCHRAVYIVTQCSGPEAPYFKRGNLVKGVIGPYTLVAAGGGSLVTHCLYTAGHLVSVMISPKQQISE